MWQELENKKWKRYFKNKRFTTGSLLLTALILLAFIVPICSPYSYTEQNVELANHASSLSHLFGTDKFGRDIFVRVWYGTRISLEVGVVSALINGGIGIIYGSVAGYVGGKMDIFLMRIADILDAIPSLLYVILIMLVLGAGVKSVILGICISGWIETARILRGEIIRLKKQEFSLAMKLAGASNGRILVRHLLPNASGPVFVSLTFLVPKAIFTEAFLSFVGVGIAAPAASLGTLIQDARSQMQIYPYQMLFPMLVLCVLILSIHLVGIGIQQEGI